MNCFSQLFFCSSYLNKPEAIEHKGQYSTGPYVISVIVLFKIPMYICILTFRHCTRMKGIILAML